MYNPQLEVFVRVADAGSFNKAAEKLHITPPAIIRQVNLLEEKLDVTLFTRTHSGLILTEAGKSLYNDTKYIMQYCRESVVRAKNAAQKDTHLIRIGTSPMTPAQILLKLWPKIHESCPDIKFQLVPFDNTPENAREILKNLGKNIDLVAGLFDDTMLNFRECAGLKLIQEPFCCAVSVNHRLANKRFLNIEDLYGENLMLLCRGRSHYIDKLRDDLWENHPEIHIKDFDFYNVNVFDIYLLHRDDPDVDIGVIVEIFNALHAEGKIGAFGGSNWTHQRIEQANEYAYVHNLIPFSVSSPNFSLAYQVNDPWGHGCVTISGSSQAEARRWYEQNGMPVIAYSSLGRGLFSGKLKSTEADKAASILDGTAMKGYGHPENFERLHRCELLAEKKEASVPQIAMAWIYNQKINSFAVVSTTKAERMRENIDALHIKLSDEELAYLNLEREELL